MRLNTAIALALIGCSSGKLECGEGTTEVDGECVPGGGWGSTGTGGTLESAPNDWIGYGSLYEYDGGMPLFDESTLAWRITRGDCVPSGSDLICDYRVLLTGKIGRNCKRCDDQVVDVDLRYTSDGQILLENLALVEGSGLPWDFTFRNLALPLTPKAPFEEGEVNVLSGTILGPVDLEYVYSGWIMLRMGAIFVDESGRNYENCHTFAYTEPPDGPDYDSDLVTDDTLRITSCSGVGVVQVDGAVGPMIRAW
jgi:hypothetical protein